MKPKWLLQTDIFEENLNLLCDEIQRQGMEYRIYDHKQFGDGKDVIDKYSKGDCVIVYGSLQMGRVFQKNSTWIPGVYCDLPKYDCSYYYPYFGHYLINEDYIMIPFGELRRQREFIFDTLGEGGYVFVRPDSGFKTFTGTTCSYKNWEDDVRFLNTYQVDSNAIVIVSSAKNLDKEWRFVVVDDKVISGSQYRNASGVKLDDAPKRVYNYAQSVVNNTSYSPERVWCLDICEDIYGFSVLEVGCFSCAGLYVAPKEPIVREVSRIALEEWNSYQDV